MTNAVYSDENINHSLQIFDNMVNSLFDTSKKLPVQLDEKIKFLRESYQMILSQKKKGRD